MRYIFLILSLFALLSIAPSQILQACSGGPSEPTSFNTRLENVDYLVKATVIETDDAGGNLILQAENYLTGGVGPQFLLLHRVSVALSSIYWGHQYETGCTQGGARQLPVGFSAYFMIRRAENGAYTFGAGGHDANTLILPIERIYVRVDPAGEDTEENLERIEIPDEQQFLDLVAQISGETPAQPDETTPYPLVSPLLITTEAGTQYIFPIDGGALVTPETPLPPRSNWSPNNYPGFFEIPDYCAEVGCELVSPDFSLRAEQADETTIEVQLNYQNLSSNYVYTLQGQAFAFSADSQMLLQWNADRLIVTWVVPVVCAMPEVSCGGNDPFFDLLAEIPLSTSDTIGLADLYGHAMWSADGTTLTYADASGVWVLDVFHTNTPQLVVEAPDGHFLSPLFLSTTGRYLAYTENRESRNWLTWDRFLEQVFENAIPSPNERFMIAIDPPNPISNAGFEITGCPMPVTETCYWTLNSRPRQLAWIDDEIYFAFNGEEVFGGNFMLLLGQHQITNVVPDYSGYLADVDYEPHHQVFALVVRRDTIKLTNMHDANSRYAGLEINYDLGNQLDGDIVDIEWLPSLFYYAQ